MCNQLIMDTDYKMLIALRENAEDQGLKELVEIRKDMFTKSYKEDDFEMEKDDEGGQKNKKYGDKVDEAKDEIDKDGGEDDNVDNDGDNENNNNGGGNDGENGGGNDGENGGKDGDDGNNGEDNGENGDDGNNCGNDQMGEENNEELGNDSITGGEARKEEERKDESKENHDLIDLKNILEKVFNENNNYELLGKGLVGTKDNAIVPFDMDLLSTQNGTQSSDDNEKERREMQYEDLEDIVPLSLSQEPKISFQVITKEEN